MRFFFGPDPVGRVVTMFVWTLAPLMAILISEHLILTRAYKKRSALQRLLDRSRTSTTDIVSSATIWLPLPGLVLLWRILTVPGLALIAVMWLDRQLGWNGLLAAAVPESAVLRTALWFVVFDFGHYVTHVAMHRNARLWRYHKFHHASSEMTILNGSRTSFAERAFTTLFNHIFLLLLLGTASPSSVAAVVLGRRIIEAIQHSDLPWDYGIAGRVLAGPRFHRMHHSTQPEDIDANFGNLFSFWDHLFGTVSDRYKSLGPAIADTVELGLETPEATDSQNDWRLSFTAGTWLDRSP